MERITEPAIKRPPSPSRIAFQHAYIASPQQVDSNLLILLHGLGDTQASFVDLGKQLQRALPQCAVLALRGARTVPLLGGGMWWDAWDPLGEMLPASAQNPSAFIEDCHTLLDELRMCGWQSEHVHLLGFGQGATAALEGTHAWCRANKRLLGSVVAVCGGMLSVSEGGGAGRGGAVRRESAGQKFEMCCKPCEHPCADTSGPSPTTHTPVS
ncbi:hypothetical protein IE81DRAFT_352147 [Ceraceosorus guamensis]|uniref:Phospholipase/carboxylesterase/thioesterase domain-containing protein n=1 Tax=Ceraceosorus guamensis TaxID=1522189 RepID=A0A316VPJ4_9BASI|nr:hypothetical protein IE81DRAFT_352147 [Ceraceosorus guamensis]PWN39496.1 hypothetical protein IE81DRAFT_352147 [Ceraceosorus guamensis]